MLIVCALWPAATSVGSAQATEDALDERIGEWMVVGQIEYGTIYLDTARIVPVDRDSYRVRTLWRFARPQHDPNGDSYRSSVAVRAIDCEAHAMAILAFADQDGARVVNRLILPQRTARWEGINSASVIDQVAAQACRLGRSMRRAGQLVSGG